MDYCSSSISSRGMRLVYLSTFPKASASTPYFTASCSTLRWSKPASPAADSASKDLNTNVLMRPASRSSLVCRAGAELSCRQYSASYGRSVHICTLRETLPQVLSCQGSLHHALLQRDGLYHTLLTLLVTVLLPLSHNRAEVLDLAACTALMRICRARRTLLQGKTTVTDSLQYKIWTACFGWAFGACTTVAPCIALLPAETGPKP